MHQGRDGVAKRFGHVLGRPAKLVAIAGRKAHAIERLLDVGRHLARRALGHISVHGHFAGQVAPVDLVRAGGCFDTGHLVQPHGALAAIGRGEGEGQAFQVLWGVAGVGREAHVHVVGLVVGRAPVAHGLAGHQNAQRAADLRHAQAQVRRGLALHHHVERGLVGLDARIQVHQAGDVADLLVHQFGQPLQLFQVGALQRELDLFLPTHRVEQTHVGDGDAGHLAQPVAQHVGHLVHTAAALVARLPAGCRQLA